MELALAVNQNLLQFFRLFDNPCRIFLTHTVKHGHHLFRIGLVHRLDGAGIFRIRIFDEIETVVAIFSVQRVSGLDIFQLHRTADVAGPQLVYLFTVCTCTDIKLGNTFF